MVGGTCSGPGRKGGGNGSWQELVLATTPVAWGEPSTLTLLLHGGWSMPGDSTAGVGRVQQCWLNPWLHSVLRHLPALHSSCRLVIRYLKNSYTDHAMAVEGIW